MSFFENLTWACTDSQASAGYPFMIQIVGYRAWREAKRRNPENGNVIQLDDVTRALPASRRRFEARVIEPARVGLSERSLAHLETMAGLEAGDGAARSSEVAESRGGTARSLFPAWARLLGLDLVESPGRDMLRFILPYMRECLLDRVAAE